MKNLWRFLPLLFALALLIPFSAAPAAAVACGDTSGPGGTDVPCSCGDIVTTNTVLNASDPVVNGVCSPVGLYVDADVNLDAHLLNMRCGPPPSPPGSVTIGINIIGDSIEIFRGIVRGCSLGVYGFTSGSVLERVTVRDSLLHFSTVFPSGIGAFLIGIDNTLVHNLCHNNPAGGIVLTGDHNTLERNYCAGNGADGISVTGSFNQLNHNQGRNNAIHGVFVIGGNNSTDERNYAAGNGVDTECSIDGQSVTPDGTYC